MEEEKKKQDKLSKEVRAHTEEAIKNIEDEGIDFDGELRLSYFGPGEFSDVELVGE